MFDDTKTVPIGAALERLPADQRRRVKQLLEEQSQQFSSVKSQRPPTTHRATKPRLIPVEVVIEPPLPETDKVTVAPSAAHEPAVTMVVRLLIPKKATAPHLTPVYIASLLDRHGRLCRHIYYLIDGKHDIVALSTLRHTPILEVKYLIQLLINDGLVEMTYQDIVYTSQQADHLD